MKRSISIFLAVVMLMAMSIPALAAEPDERGFLPVVPRYVAITSIRAMYSISGSTATCTASISQSGAKANVKLILQRSTNSGVSYSDFATLSNKTYTTKNIMAEASKSGLTTSYKYRTKVVVTVYNASGNQIDLGTAYS